MPSLYTVWLSNAPLLQSYKLDMNGIGVQRYVFPNSAPKSIFTGHKTIIVVTIMSIKKEFSLKKLLNNILISVSFFNIECHLDLLLMLYQKHAL